LRFLGQRLLALGRQRDFHRFFLSIREYPRGRPKHGLTNALISASERNLPTGTLLATSGWPIIHPYVQSHI
jgi:hypothetical protein